MTDSYEVLVQWLAAHATIERLQGGSTDRWLQGNEGFPLWRCVNGHVVGSRHVTPVGETVCTICRAPALMTFPEDATSDPAAPLPGPSTSTPSVPLPPMPDRWARVYRTHTANPSWSDRRAAAEPGDGGHIAVVRYVAVPESVVRLDVREVPRAGA